MFGHRPRARGGAATAYRSTDVSLRPVFDEIWLEDDRSGASSSLSVVSSSANPPPAAPPSHGTTTATTTPMTMTRNPLGDGARRKPFDFDTPAAEILQRRHNSTGGVRAATGGTTASLPVADRDDDNSPPPRLPLRTADDFFPYSRPLLGDVPTHPAPPRQPLTVAQALLTSNTTATTASDATKSDTVNRLLGAGPHQLFRAFNPSVDGPDADRSHHHRSVHLQRHEKDPVARAEVPSFKPPSTLQELAVTTFIVPDAAQAASRSQSVATSVDVRERVEGWLRGEWALPSGANTAARESDRSGKQALPYRHEPPPVPRALQVALARQAFLSSPSAPPSVACLTETDARSAVWADLMDAEDARDEHGVHARGPQAPQPAAAAAAAVPMEQTQSAQIAAASLRAVGSEFSRNYTYVRRDERGTSAKQPIDAGVVETAATALRRLRLGLPLQGNEVLLGVAYPEIDGDALDPEASRTRAKARAAQPSTLRPSAASPTARLASAQDEQDEAGPAPKLMDLFGRRWVDPRSEGGAGLQNPSPFRTVPLFSSTTSGGGTTSHAAAAAYFVSPQRRPADDSLNFAVFKLL